MYSSVRLDLLTVLLFSLLTPPSRYTLFPYTTLFRSDKSYKGVLEYSDEPLVSHDIIGNPHSCIFDSKLTIMLDRKSTRLNSSHLGISYAVFCLKKKKKKHQQTYYMIR